MMKPLDSVMLRTLLGPLVAGMQLFAVYVLMHGHYSPGGGFQAGILIAGSMILPLLVPGRGYGRLNVSLRAAASLAAVGVLIFAVVGAASLPAGRPMLDYAALPLAGEPAARRSLGILLIEVGVMLGVAGGMLSIFHALSGRSAGERER